MTRVVIDTNVFISGLIKRNGVPGRILHHQRRGDFEVIISAPLLEELEAVLNRPHILELTRGSRSSTANFANRLRTTTVVVAPTVAVAAVERDPADNRVLEAAVAGRADFIITGDTDLLELGTFGAVRILTPAQFLTIVKHRD